MDKRSPSGNRKGLQENSFRDLRNLTSNNIPPPSPTLNTSKGHHQSRAFSPRTNRAALLSPRTAHTTQELRASVNQGSVSSPRYYHHMHHRHLPPTPWSPPGSKTLEPSNNGAGHHPHHYIHPPRCVDLADDDFENFAFNGNVCLCEEQWSGTQRLGVSNRLMRSVSGSSGPCRQCGLDKLIIKSGSQRIRKAQSEESVTNGDPYDLVRRQRLIAAEQEHQQHMLLHHHHHHVHGPPHHPHPPHHIHHHIHPTSPPLQMELNSNPAMQWFEDHLDQPPLNDDDEEEVNNDNGDNDEDDHALEYAEADYIYNAVSRRLPIPPNIPQSVLQMRHQKRLEIEAMIKKQHRSKSQTKPEGFHPLVRSSSSVVRSSSANKMFNTTFNSLKRKVKDDQKVKSRQRPPSNSQDPSPPNLPLPPPPVPSSASTRPATKTQKNMPKRAPLSSVSVVTSAMNKSQKSNRMKTNKSSNYKSIEDVTTSSSPLSSVPSESSGSNNEIVTVNGGHGTKNSSIIYLSPDRSTPSRSLSTNTSDAERMGHEQAGETLIRIKRNGKSGQQLKTLNTNSAAHSTTMVTINDFKADTTVLPVTHQDNNTRVSTKLIKNEADNRDESETDFDERGDSNTHTSDTHGDNDTADTSEKESSADEISDDSVLQSCQSHQDKVLKLTKQNEERRKQMLDKNSDKIHSTKITKNTLDKKDLIIDLEQCEEDSDYDADLSCTLESPNKGKAIKDKVSLVQGGITPANQTEHSHRQKIIVKGPKHQMQHHMSQESTQEDGDELIGKPVFQFSKNRLQNFPQKSTDSSQRIIKRVDGTTTSSDSESIHSGLGGLNSRRSSLSGDELAPGGIKSSRASTSKLVQLYQRRKQMQQLSLSNENTYSEPPEIDLNEVSISDSRKSNFSNHLFKDFKQDCQQKSLPPQLGSSSQRPETSLVQDDIGEESANLASLTSFQQVASKYIIIYIKILSKLEIWSREDLTFSSNVKQFVN